MIVFLICLDLFFFSPKYRTRRIEFFSFPLVVLVNSFQFYFSKKFLLSSKSISRPQSTVSTVTQHRCSVIYRKYCKSYGLVECDQSNEPSVWAVRRTSNFLKITADIIAGWAITTKPCSLCSDFDRPRRTNAFRSRTVYIDRFLVTSEISLLSFLLNVKRKNNNECKQIETEITTFSAVVPLSELTDWHFATTRSESTSNEIDNGVDRFLLGLNCWFSSEEQATTIATLLAHVRMEELRAMEIFFQTCHLLRDGNSLTRTTMFRE